MPARPPLAKLLFIGDATGASDTAALIAALTTAGVACTWVRAWSEGCGSPPGRGTTRLQTVPFALFCADDIARAAPVIALVDPPDFAVACGSAPAVFARPVRATGISTLLWYTDDLDPVAFDHPGVLPDPEHDTASWLAAANVHRARWLSALTGQTVHTLRPAAAEPPGEPSAGPEVLLLARRRLDGRALAGAMARARPDLRFSLADPDRTGQPVTGRIALLPAMGPALPWAALADALAAGLPVLASDEPLLRQAIGHAGRCLPATAPLPDWLEALDALMRAPDGEGPQTARIQARALRLPPAEAAREALRLLESLGLRSDPDA